MEPARNVALLALIYRENYCAHRTSLDAIGDDQDTCPGEISWLTMLAVGLPQLDWAILTELEQSGRFGRVAQGLEPLRAEAVLHAKPPDGHRTRMPWAAGYTAPKRWLLVREHMRRHELRGLTTTRDDLELVASRAWGAATGDTLGQYLDQWEPAT